MSSKEVKIKITGDISDLLKKLETVKDSLNELGKDRTNNKGINSLVDDLSDVIKKSEQAGDSLEELNDATKKTKSNGIQDLKEDLVDIDKKSDKASNSFKDFNKQLNNIETTGLNNISESMTSIANIGEEVKEMFVDCGKLFDSFTGEEINLGGSKLNNNFASSITSGLIEGTVAGKAMANAFSGITEETLNFAQVSNTASESARKMSEYYTNLQRELDRAKDKFVGFSDVIQNQDISEFVRNIAKSQAEIAKIDYDHYKGEVDKVVSSLKEQEDAYESLKKQALEYLDDEDKSISNKKKLAEAVDKAAKSLRDMGSEVEGIPTDKIKALNDEFNAFMKESGKNNAFKNIIDDLNKLDKALDDKATKTEKNRQENKKYAESNDEVAKSITKQAESIKKFGDSADYAVEKIKSIDEATGEVTETVKIMDRAMKDVGDSIEEAMDPKAIEECNEAWMDYLSNLERLDASSVEKFMTNGAFDKNKYFEYFNKFGKPIEQLTSQFKTLRTQILELAQDEKVSLEDKARSIKMINEQAEALRKLGVAAEDISKADIADFDKSLASQLDSLSRRTKEFKDLFSEDIPSTFKDFAQDLSSAFDELQNLEFGNAFDLLKSAGKGLFQMMPSWVKTAGTMVVGMDKLYQVGKKQFFEGIINFGSKLQPVINAVQSFGREVASAFENITGLDLDLSSLMEIGPTFEAQMARVQAISGATKSEITSLSKQARTLGIDFGYGAIECADALEYMGMAGWSATEMMEALPSVLKLAKISGTDLATVSDIVTDDLTALGYSASYASDFVDILAGTITNSNTNVELFGKTLKNCGPIAGTLGVSMRDLSIAVGLMANSSVKGEKAGTALKNLMTNMAQPTEKMTKCIQQYGLAEAQTAIQNGQLIDGIKILKEKLQGLDAATQASIITTLAGKEALSGVAALVNSSEKDFTKLQYAVDTSTKIGAKWATQLGIMDKKTGEINLKNEEAVKRFDMMTAVLNETTQAAEFAGLSTQELGGIIQILGEDGEVSAEQVNDLLTVFTNLQNPTKAQAAAMKEYGIEVKKADDGTLNFSETIKGLYGKWDKMDEGQRKAMLSAMGLGNSYDELNELFSHTPGEIESIIGSLAACEGAADRFKEVVSGTAVAALRMLAANIADVAISAFEMLSGGLQKCTDALNEFFDDWRSMDKNNMPTWDGFELALNNLATKVEGAKPKIEKAISGLFENLDRFVNGGSLDSILKIGTDIIDGICNGIEKAKQSGTLDSAIDGAIKKICKFIETNGPKVEKAGKTIMDSLRNGIEKNKKEISKALDTVMSVIDTWAKSSDKLDATMGTFADKMVDSLAQAVGRAVDKKKGEIWKELGSILTPDEMPDFTKPSGLTGFGNILDWLLPDTTEPPKTAGEKIFGFAKDMGKKFLSWFTGESYAAEVEDSGLKTTDNYNKGLESGAEGTKSASELLGNTFGQGIVEAINNSKTAVTTAFTEMQNGARTAMVGMADIARNQFLNMSNIVRNQMLNCTNIVRNQAVNMANIFRNQFVNMANIARNQFVNVANIVRNQMVNSCNIVRNQCVNMANIFRNQFVSMANVARNQMVNVSNIVRNQAVAWSNIIRNQCQNARNALTSSMLSMAAVARTQMVNITNIVRNQAVAWANIVRSQSANMRGAMSSAFSGLAAVAARGMAACLATVRSYMAQIRAATAQTMTMNFRVNKTVTTTNVTKNVTQSLGSTMASIASNTVSLASPQAVTVGGSMGRSGLAAGATERQFTIYVPLSIDGRQIAKATAVYNEEQLAKLSTRNNRKRGE